MFYHNDYIRFRHSLNVLGLTEGATFDETKEQHRQLVKRWHPDRFVRDPAERVGAEERMKRINEAYTWLEVHRSLFDVKWPQEKWAFQDSTTYSAEPIRPDPAVPKAHSEAKKKEKAPAIVAWLIILVANGINTTISELNSEWGIAVPLAIFLSFFLGMMWFLVSGLFLKDD